MPARWETYLKRWTEAGLIDAAAAARIRDYEARQGQAGGLRWPVLLALGLGGLLVGAGVLLFVAAHWDRLSPEARFTCVTLMVALFHVAAALAAERFPPLAASLHAIGTVCLGAGIFLAGQIFHLQEYWPAGVLLWALGAFMAWALLRDWPQAALAAVLTPLWLSGEWLEATQRLSGQEKILYAGLVLLAISYFTGLLPDRETPVRKALMWIGGLALIPATLFLIFVRGRPPFMRWLPPGPALPDGYLLAGWAAALLLPLAVALWLRGRHAWVNLAAAVWVVVLAATCSMKYVPDQSVWHHAWRRLGPYLLCALGAVGLIAWGLKEGRKERINLGVAGFALTILFFYFSSVMDKLGRAASLVGLGLLFLLGGWVLEKLRRRLVARLEAGGS